MFQKKVIDVLRNLLILALVCGASGAMAEGMAMNAGGGSVSGKAYTAAMDRMMADMHAKPTGDPDRDFVTMMLPHHQGAVDMAEVELRYGKDPQLLALARTIVADQQKEIVEMRNWLKSHPR